MKCTVISEKNLTTQQRKGLERLGLTTIKVVQRCNLLPQKPLRAIEPEDEVA